MNNKVKGSRQNDDVMVSFDPIVTIGSIEKTLASHYRSTSLASNIVLDLSNTDWIGHFPAMQVMLWAIQLQNLGRTVSVKLPLSTSAQSGQFAKAMISAGVCDMLGQAGINVVGPSFMRRALQGVPITAIESLASYRDQLELSKRRLTDSVLLSRSESLVVEEAFSTLLNELAENVLTHSKSSRAYYQLTISTASSRQDEGRDRSEFVGRFNGGERYIEVVLGDLGTGIENVLGQHVPTDWTPNGKGLKKLTKDELAVAYAFEFSSTSSESGRVERIAKLISEAANDPSSIASGLFCVLDFARRRGGTFSVRTPGSFLGFNFINRESPIAYLPRQNSGLGKKKSPTRKKICLPGTQYWLRIPLSTSNTRSRGVSVEAPLLIDAEQSVMLGSPGWADLEGQAPAEAEQLRAAVDSAHIVLRSRFRVPDYVFLLPALQQLSARANAIYHVTIQSLLEPESILVLSQYRFTSSAVHDAVKIPLSSARHVIIGDVLLNRFYQVKLDSSVEGLSTTSQSELFKISSDQINKLGRSYFENIRGLLLDLIRKAMIRGGDAAFFFGSYFTEIFFRSRLTLQNGRFIELTADWLANRLISNGSALPAIIVSTFPAMHELAVKLSERLLEATGHRIDVIEHNTGGAPTAIFRELLIRKQKNCLILTDIVCSGASIGELVYAFVKNVNVTVFSLVDARFSAAEGQPLMIARTSESIPLISLYREAIETFPRRTSISTHGEQRYERLFVVDPLTRLATLEQRHLTANFPNYRLMQLLAESRSFFTGHIDYRGRHFTSFLDLNRLFLSLRYDIKKWILEEIDGFSSKQTEKSQDPYQIRYLDTDQCLSWLPESLVTGNHRFNCHSIDVELGSNGISGAEMTGSYVVLIIPSVATGQRFRALIEWISSFQPKAILVLAVVSFMEADNFIFYQQIAAFRNSAFYLRYFLNLNSISTVANEGECQHCKSQREYENLAQVTDERFGTDHPLTRSLWAQAQRLRRQPASAMLEPDRMPIGLPDVARVELKMAIASHRSGRGITDFQDTGREALELLYPDLGERLLRLVSAERPSPNAGLHPLLEGSPTLLEFARDRASSVLFEPLSEVPFSNMVSGICQIAPEEFVESSPSLILTYAKSQRDLEEILASLLLMRRFPSDFQQIVEILQESQETKAAAALVVHAYEMYRIIRGHKQNLNEMEFVSAWQRLNTQLIRSVQFASHRERMSEMGLLDADAIIQQVVQFLKHWRSDVLLVLNELSSSARWHHLTEGTGIDTEVDGLKRAVGVLEQCCSSARIQADSAMLRARVVECGESIAVAGYKIVNFLTSFYASPVHLKFCELNPAGPALPEFNFTSEVDRSCPLVFTKISELDTVCDCVWENWIDAARLCAGSSAFFRLTYDGMQATLHFRDNFPGEFNFRSQGGLRTIEEYCRNHAAGLQKTEIDNGGWKSLEIQLPCLHPATKKVLK